MRDIIYVGECVTFVKHLGAPLNVMGFRFEVINSRAVSQASSNLRLMIRSSFRNAIAMGTVGLSYL